MQTSEPVPAARRLAAVVIAAIVATAPAHAQFYEKVDLRKAAVDGLTEALTGSDEGTGGRIAALAGTQDPRIDPVFRAMAASSRPGERVYGVLGQALASGKGLDPVLMAALPSADERSAVVREANITGILRKTPVAELLAQGQLSKAATLSIVAELERRGERWDPALVRPFVAASDPVPAGLASLLLRDGKGQGTPDPAAWDAFRTRLLALAEDERNMTLRALVEAAMLFELRTLAPTILELARQPEFNEDTRIGAIGMALRLDSAAGIAAWQDQVAANKSQPALVRCGLQLLASSDRGVPPTAFDAIRNGSPILDAIADAGSGLAGGKDPAAALVILLDCGHSKSAEWALVRAAELPAATAAPVWKHIAARMDDADPANRPTAPLVSGLTRELMKTDPAAVEAIFTRVKGNPELEVAAMTGVADSHQPAAVEVARRHRGSLPRAAEGLAVLTLARAGAPLNDADIDILGRAAGGGGDLDGPRALQAAWYYTCANRKAEELISRIGGASSPAAAPPAVPPTAPPAAPKR